MSTATALATVGIRTFDWLDYLVLGAYLATNLVVGWRWARRRQSADGFFRGERRVRWWAAGISFYATATTSISFMAVPAKSYATDWRAIGSAPAQAAATLVIAFCFVGALRRLNITTVFEYLDLRFGRAVRLLGAALSVLLKVFGRMSVVMLLPAMALASVTGFNVYACIAILGGVTVAYAMLGGFTAVLWTDVFQFVVMFGGVAIALCYVAAGVPGGFGGILETGWREGKLAAVSWEWDFTEPTVWVFAGLMVRTVFTQLSDQSLMQRVFATADERAARRTVALGALLGLPSSVLFFFVGTALFAFYRTHTAPPAGLPNDAIFPFFIVSELPRGVVGLVIAGVLASAMGALSSDVNSAATVIATDFLPLFRAQPTDRQKLAVARGATIAAGLAATLTAAYLASLNVPSLWDQVLMLAALIGGGLPGVFALGLLTRRATAPGVIVGVLISVGVTAWLQAFTSINPFFQGFAAVMTCLVTGYGASLCLPSRAAPRDLRGLTVWDLARTGR
ncbi:MAG: sodium:solute symporter [Opitutae bacterium]|nr:sodium:solute symporter [Opitutae bacterium]